MNLLTEKFCVVTDWKATTRAEEREIFIDNLLVRIHWIVEMIVVERPCAMGV
jgi:hypothetical protein